MMEFLYFVLKKLDEIYFLYEERLKTPKPFIHFWQNASIVPLSFTFVTDMSFYSFVTSRSFHFWHIILNNAQNSQSLNNKLRENKTTPL
jgi:hypothetical protein